MHTIRTLTLALAAAATLAACDSAAPLGSGEGAALPPDGLRHASAPFPAPANLTAEGPGADSLDRRVTLTWEDVAGDEMYVVQWRRGDGPDVWKSLVSTGRNRTTYATDSMSFLGSNDYRVAVLTSDFRTGAYAVVRLKPGAFAGGPALLLSDSVAKVKGRLRTNGSDTWFWFEYGTDPQLAGAATSYKRYASGQVPPLAPVEETVVGKAGMMNYYRLVASGQGGTSYGPIVGYFGQAIVPGAPTEVSAVFSAEPVPLGSGSSVGHNVTLRWTHDGTDAADFRVSRRPVGTNSWTLTVLKAGTPDYVARRFVDQSLPVAADVEYEYYVSACAEGGQCRTAVPVRVLVKGVPAPAGVTATQGADGRVTISWQDLPTEDEYLVHWRPGETENWQTLVSTRANVTSYTTDRVTAGVNNHYRVAGQVRTFRTGAFATTSVAATAGYRLQAETGPATPGSQPSLTRVSGTVTPAGIPTTGWFEWGTDPALATFTRQGMGPVGSGTSTGTVFHEIASAAGTYYYRFVAANAVDTVRGSIRSYNIGPPYAPALTASYDGAAFRATLQWTHSGTVVAASFRVERRLTGTTAWREINSVSGSTRSYVDASLPVDSARSYDYRVRACAADASCTPSSVVAVQAQGLAAPAGLTAVRTAAGEVTLSWQDIAGELGYVVQWRTDPAGPWKHVVSTGANRTEYATTSVTPGTTNYYRVAGEASGFRHGAFSQVSITVP